MSPLGENKTSTGFIVDHELVDGRTVRMAVDELFHAIATHRILNCLRIDIHDFRRFAALIETAPEAIPAGI